MNSSFVLSSAVHQITVTLQTIGAVTSHGCIGDGGSMTANTVSIDDLTAICGKTDARRIISRRFMDKIVESGAGFVDDFTGNIGVGQVAFGAGELLMIGRLPSAMHGFHAVTGSAESRITGLLVGQDGNRGKNDADQNAGNQKF